MDFIEDFLGGNRYFGIWSSSKRMGGQFKVYSKNDVIEYLHEYGGLINCGISITTFVRGMPKLLFLPFDFDSDNEKESFDDAYKLYTFIKDAGYNVMMNRSGGKGYHVLIQTEPKTYSKQQLRSIQELFKRILNLETSDTQIISDIRRLIRIPGTYHVNGQLCETILSHSIGKKLDISEFASPTDSIYIPEDFEIHDQNYTSHIYHEYPCIKELIKGEEPRQFVRFCWVIEQDHERKTEEEMIEFAREYWVDYDPTYSLYQIRFISNGKYSHPSCDTIESLGFCKGKSCPYYEKWQGVSNGN